MNNIDILYQDERILVAQTYSSGFDKFAKDDVYGSYNTGLHVGDDARLVLANRADVLRQLSTHSPAVTSIHWLNQVHGNDVVRANDSGFTLMNADAHISHKVGQALAIMTADCVPIAIFGRSQSSGVACIHAGWQGLVKGVIHRAATSLMADDDFCAVIGACISQDAYQMPMDLARRIVRESVQGGLVACDEEVLFEELICSDGDDKCLFDIQKLARLQLEHLGITVLSDEIKCSYQNPDYYSYRAQTHADKSATGRMAMVVAKLQ